MYRMGNETLSIVGIILEMDYPCKHGLTPSLKQDSNNCNFVFTFPHIVPSCPGKDADIAWLAAIDQ